MRFTSFYYTKPVDCISAFVHNGFSRVKRGLVKNGILASIPSILQCKIALALSWNVGADKWTSTFCENFHRDSIHHSEKAVIVSCHSIPSADSELLLVCLNVSSFYKSDLYIRSACARRLHWKLIRSFQSFCRFAFVMKRRIEKLF